MRMSYLLVVLPALAGVVLAALAYFTPNTGVDGTVGGALALAGAVAVTLGALLAMVLNVRGGFRTLLHILLAIGAALTAIAAWFLMKPAFAAVMIAALLGLLVAIFIPDRRRTA